MATGYRCLGHCIHIKVMVKVNFTVGQVTKTKRKYGFSSTLSLTLALVGCGWSSPHLGRSTSADVPVPFVEGITFKYLVTKTFSDIF